LIRVLKEPVFSVMAAFFLPCSLIDGKFSASRFDSLSGQGLENSRGVRDERREMPPGDDRREAGQPRVRMDEYQTTFIA
jgi:hypothetical protein